MNHPVLLWVAIGIFVLLALFIYCKNRQVNRFQKECRVNDMCMFFIGEDRVMGKIIARYPDSVTIQFGDLFYSRAVTEIYPS